MSDEPIIIRDARSKERFSVDDEYLNGYAKLCGVNATSVYLCLCRHANFYTQTSFPSVENMSEKLGLNRKTIIKAIKTLEEWNIILKQRMRHYESGEWLHNTYTLLDKSTWKPKPHVPQNGLGTTSHSRVITTSHQRDTKGTHTKGTHTSKAKALQERELEIPQNISIVTYTEEERPKKASTAKYPNARTAFKWLPKYEKHWDMNKTYLSYGELMFEKGEEKVKNLVNFAEENKNDPFCPQIITPYDVITKWSKLQAFRDKR